jgi:hypothetical protein
MEGATMKKKIGKSKFVTVLNLGKPEGKRPLGRPRRTWVDNIKVDLTEI